MGENPHMPSSDNHCLFFFWSTCGLCGLLPLVGLAVGFVLFIPCTLVGTVCIVAISIIMIPHDIFFTYYTVLATKHLGPRIKVLLMLSLWFPLLMWPPLVFVSTVIATATVTLFAPIGYTFAESGYWFWKAAWKTLKLVGDGIKWFWDFQMHGYFTYLADYRGPYDGEPWDVAFDRIFAGILLSVWGVLFCGFSIMVLTLVKALPYLGKGYYYLWKWYAKSEFMAKTFFFIPFILANVLLPIGWLFCLVILAFHGFFWGLYVGWPTYDKGITAGLKESLHIIKTYDQVSNEFIGCQCGCYPGSLSALGQSNQAHKV